MALIKFSIREMMSRPLRAALTCLSIVIGVAAVVSVSLATNTTRHAQRDMFLAVSGRAALEVIAEGGGSFDQSIVTTLEQVPGVKAIPALRRYTILYAPQKKVRVQLLGIAPETDRLVHDYELVAGKFLETGTGVVLDANFAKSLGVGVGDEIKLLTRIGLKISKVIGLVEPRGGSAVSQGGLVYMTLATAQNRFKAKLHIDRVQILLDESRDVKQVQTQIAARLPIGLTVRQPVTRSQLAESTTLGTEQGLNLATAFALVIAAFIIYNTFQMNVGERRRQLGILRAIGTTRRQILLLVLREGLLMGIVGTILGSAIGVLGAYILAGSTARLLQITMPPPELSPVPFAVGALFGLGISLVGAFLPARRASQLSPTEAMRVIPSGEIEPPHIWTTLLGLAVIVAGAAVLSGCILGWVPIRNSVSSAVVVLLGIVLLLPALLEPLSRLVIVMLRPLLGVEGRLAQRQLMRHRGRTALTIGVLFIAASTGVGMANTIIDNVRDVNHWYRAAVVGDFFLRAAMPDMATGEAADMPAGLDKTILAIDGVIGLDTMRFVNAKSGQNSVVVVIREFTSDDQVYFDLVTGDPHAVLRELPRGGVVIGTVLAEKAALKLGDTIPLETREGTQQLPIVGIANDYIGGGLTIYMQRNIAEKMLAVEGVDAYIIQADDNKLAAVGSQLQQLSDENGLLLQSYAELVQFINAMMNGVIGSLWALLALGFVIAAFGMVNTLAMNILEQTRELGVLRVVAMTRWQVRKTILSQALIMGLIGLGPGTLIGVGVAYLINLATLPATGRAVQFVFRPELLAGSFCTALAIVLVAAWLPAERAARLKLISALQYE